jgi:hypothetical protein
MVDSSFSSALEGMLASIGHVLISLQQDDAEAELHTLRVHLLKVLDLVERDPGIEAASDDLYAVAKEIACGGDRGPRMSRLLNQAFFRLRDRLGSARPRHKAGDMGLT